MRANLRALSGIESFPDSEGIKTDSLFSVGRQAAIESFPDSEGIKTALCFEL